MKKYFFFQIIFFVIITFSYQAKSQRIYACTDSSTIYVLDPANCSASILCQDTIIFTDIAFEGGVLYGVTNCYILRFCIAAYVAILSRINALCKRAIKGKLESKDQNDIQNSQLLANLQIQF